MPDLFGAQLVHRQRRGQDAAAGVGNAGALEQALHGAIFATAAVQHDKGAVDLLAIQASQEIITHVDAEGIHTTSLQGTEHRVAGLQRHLALGALAAEQHGDAAEGLGIEGTVQTHFDSPTNSGCLISCGATAPISPAPWHSRMSPARSSGLSSGARSAPRST